ncbi:hypothetical protein [Ahrensia marina]|uniref:Stability/partitioning determinant n=1 Tax=Ahrensia marina TaxID=1514904 RepID=A0A0M9GL30_9HYPH|nr:hypothetical protein [Ahrensia marina]KPA99935.1 hypothetical protein SU32_16540 [Ahrensia marina]
MDTKTLNDPFADDGEGDALAASFAPVPKADEAKPSPKQSSVVKAADAVAEEQGFTTRRRSRKKNFKRSDNFRTGRNVAITVKGRTEEKATLEKLASERSWVNGQTLQYALDALQEKINDPQDSFWETHNFHGVD